ncbi:thioredoxin domain-containing protein [Granulicella tundricola]|uniref:Spermatogenesis-associated protein 20-like TRX domain-containing protein n=1 Tax=Granulicella tundricola (strain ATCC BAA-1859 / DSM 23138 / MP5ACTX9) TaxID=1198114 RepID=E8WYA5_GRATM|nr:thioredoxin domain-containing protein [Granulicella tundricola]ADW68732.1 hypothetical protein AciX9_1682 [Granulicella tundricola MP5ACTX9]
MSLAKARSAYLRSAIHQPVQWHEWSPEAFARAQAEDKPILLDIGAVWCHWCHVMDRESYENAETARLINEHFIAIKVDRDERPDVDARYQAAVAAISGQGGWPLTAFLTPQGQPYFGGTYFPPLDQHGRPGLRRVLMTMAEAFQNKREEVMDTAGSVIAAIEHNESFDGSASNPGTELVDKLIASALQQFDRRNGGFGSQPKFPNSGALDLLIDAASRVGSQDGIAAAARATAAFTLEKMSKGGIYDHLAGGFHRYSVDERWVVPHFEKMSYDNSELLKNYVHAYQTFVEPECARIAREIIRWVEEVMSDRELGGFYASQDADANLDDDGDYFTWTLAEARAALTKKELAVTAPFYDIGELGDMHHNPQKNTLHVDQPLETVAKAAGVSLDQASALLQTSLPKLYAARKTRPTPYIDKTLYTAWNAMMISAHLEAARVLADPATRLFALKTLDRVLSTAWHEGSLDHVIAYGESSEPTDPIPGILDDYAFTGHAALDAWEATGHISYFNSALALADAAITKFYDEEKGGFFDTETPAPGELRLGALSTRRKPLQDSPTPAGNPVAAALLLRLEALTGREDFKQMAKATLECFAAVVEHFGLYAATFGLALQRLLLPPIQVVIVGEDSVADRLERAALGRYAVNKTVVRLTPSQLTTLPPSLAQTLPHFLTTLGSYAAVCTGFTCRPPVNTPEALAEILLESL